MARTKDRYEASARYAMGWGENSDSLAAATVVELEADAMQRAAVLVDQMRKAGAASAIRRVRVRQWRDGSSLADAPVLYEASYYDVEQGLSDAELYAARVHDWHVAVDRVNSNLTRNNADWLLTYRAWAESWGPQPAVCPACAASLSR